MPHSSINHMPYPLDSNRNPYHLQPQYQRHGLVPSQPPHLQNPQLPRPPVFPSNPKSVNGLSQNQVQRESVSTRQLAKGATSESPSPSDTRSVSPTISATSNNAQETTTKRPPRKPLVFVCSICGGISNRKQDLQRHEATHTQIKNYVCPVLTCKFAFVRKDALSRHIKSKHRDLEK
ncbi:hypothetical protein BDR26DRAFT_857003 [Obelidium mucronatum]|nr:hypothetical protein BDR26DRAFT_857003 [Obelidium mucronatum]